MKDIEREALIQKAGNAEDNWRRYKLQCEAHERRIKQLEQELEKYRMYWDVNVIDELEDATKLIDTLNESYIELERYKAFYHFIKGNMDTMDFQELYPQGLLFQFKKKVKEFGD